MVKQKYRVVRLNAKCWYGCGKTAQGVLIFKDGSEVPACKQCGALHGKVKRLRKHTLLSDRGLQQAKTPSISFIKSNKNAILTDFTASNSADRTRIEQGAVKYPLPAYNHTQEENTK